jgi:gliding motility-associated-like protein
LGNLKYYRNFFLFILCLGAFNLKLDARHIVGGDVTYECLGLIGTNRVEYRVTLIMYRDATDANAADFDNEISFGIFRGSGNNWDFVRNIPVRLREETRIIPESPSPCLTIPTFNIFRGVYTFNVTLNLINEDYMFAYQRCCRNNTINNINNPGDMGAAFTAILTAEGQASCNNSPVFDDFPPIVICANRGLNFNHGATDAEGDQLEYSFCSPLTAGGQGGTRPNDPPGSSELCDGVTPDPQNCRPPFATVSFIVPQFNETQPLAGNPVVRINPTTGLITGTPELLGQFVVGVCVREFRNGQLIGEIRRDFQFNVELCTVNVEVDMEAELLGPKSYRVQSCGSNQVEIANLSEEADKIFSYDWEFNIGGGDTLFSGERSPSLLFPGIGSYPGRLILNRTDSICADTASIRVDIFPAIEADFSVDYDTCGVGPVSFTDETVTGAPSIVAWDWSFGDGDESSVQNPIHSYQEPAEYTATLVARDINNCIDTITSNFLWAPVPPLVVVEPSLFIGCAPGVISFNNLSDPVNELYDIIWNFGDGQQSTDINPTHIYDEPGEYSVNLTITSPFGCTISKNYNDWITIRESPIADFTFTPEQPTIFNREVEFTDLSIDAMNWIWDFAGIDFSDVQNPTFTFPDTGVYDIELVVQHPSGCTDTLRQRVDIEPVVTLFFPNAFTPNNDGLNEDFKGVGFIAGIVDYTMTIWNRWGEQIFITEDPAEGWNGRVENTGDLVQEGVYVYTVDYTDPRGRRVDLKGTVTVVR